MNESPAKDVMFPSHFMWAAQRPVRSSTEVRILVEARSTASTPPLSYDDRQNIWLLLRGVILGDEEALLSALYALLFHPPFVSTTTSGSLTYDSPQTFRMLISRIPSTLDVEVVLIPLLAAVRMGRYDSRLRVASRLLCSLLSIPFSVVVDEEERVAQQAKLYIQDLVTSSSQVQGNQMSVYRAMKIGAFAAIGGTVLTVTGGLAAPMVGPAYSAVVAGVGTSLSAVGSAGVAVLGGGAASATLAAAGASTAHIVAVGGGLLAPLFSATNVSVMCGLMGAGIGGFKGYRRTDDTSDFLLRRVDSRKPAAQAAKTPTEKSTVMSVFPSSTSEGHTGVVVPAAAIFSTFTNVRMCYQVRKRFRHVICGIHSCLPKMTLSLRAYSLTDGAWVAVPPAAIPEGHCGILASVNHPGFPTGTGFMGCYEATLLPMSTGQVKPVRLWFRVSVNVLGVMSHSCFCEPMLGELSVGLAEARLVKGKCMRGLGVSADCGLKVEITNSNFLTFKLLPECSSNGLPSLPTLTAFPLAQLVDRRAEAHQIVKAYRRQVSVSVVNESSHNLQLNHTTVSSGQEQNPREVTDCEPIDVPKDSACLSIFTNKSWSLNGVEVSFMLEAFHCTGGSLHIRLDVQRSSQLLCFVAVSKDLSEVRDARAAFVAPTQVKPIIVGNMKFCVQMPCESGLELTAFDAEAAAASFAQTVVVTGYLDIFNPRFSMLDQPVALWEPVLQRSARFSKSDCFVLQWDTEYQLSFGETINSDLLSKGCLQDQVTGITQSVTTNAILSGIPAFSAFLAYKALWCTMWVPLCAVWAADVIDNAFASLSCRAERTGRELAHALLQGPRPTSLIGFSFGGSVLCHCLLELYKQKAFGIVENVFLIGCPFSGNADAWRQMTAVTAGRLVNVFSTKDWVLWMMHRTNSSLLHPVAGLSAINSPEVESADGTNLAAQHFQIASQLGNILSSVEPFPTARVWEARHRHGACGAVVTGEDSSTMADAMALSLQSFAEKCSTLVFSLHNVILANSSRDGSITVSAVEQHSCHYGYEPPSQVAPGEAAVFGIIAEGSVWAGCFFVQVDCPTFAIPANLLFFFLHDDQLGLHVGIRTFPTSFCEGAPPSLSLDEMKGYCTYPITQDQPIDLLHRTSVGCSDPFADGDTDALVSVSCGRTGSRVSIEVRALLAKECSRVERAAFTREDFLKRMATIALDGVTEVKQLSLLQADLALYRPPPNSDCIAVVVVNSSDSKMFMDSVSSHAARELLSFPPTVLPPQSFFIISVLKAPEPLEATEEESSDDNLRCHLFRYSVFGTAQSYTVQRNDSSAVKISCTSTDAFSTTECSRNGNQFVMLFFSPLSVSGGGANPTAAAAEPHTWKVLQ